MEKLIFKEKLLLKVILMFLIYVPFSTQAQSVKRQCISSYGSTGKSISGVYLQTVGQPYNSTVSHENNYTFLPGFQQPIVLKVENMDAMPLQGIELKVFPNPTAYSVAIQSVESIEKAVIHVMDLNGHVVLSDYAEKLETYNINCEAWANGTYFITVSDGNQNKNSLKLIINK
ncbi:MAG: T9SS type A sorting domain-containing protein [Salinivirgaceae bacterium]